MRRHIVAWLIMGVALAACSTNPTTGRSQFNYMSRDEEIKTGAEAKPEMTQEFGGEVPSPELHEYIAGIGKRIASVTEGDNPSLPWEFTFLNSDVVNAFALPGGKVFVTRGLAKEMTNEAQMAAVIGHECGHVTARHTNDRMGQQILLTGGGAVLGGIAGAAANKDDRAGGAAIGAGVGAAAGGIWALAYSRDQEIEADRLGARYMEKLKYNPQGAIQVQQILQRLSKGNTTPAIFSTHPPSEDRIRALQERMQKYYQHTVGNPQYQLFEERFKTQFLAKLATLPPPPPPPPPAAEKKAGVDQPLEGTRAMMASAVLGDPTRWCAVCAARAAAPERP